MPKQIVEAKKLIALLKKDTIRAVRIKNNADNTKFKVRCAKYLYTYICEDKAKAEEIKKMIPSTVQVMEINKKVPKAE